MPSVLPNLILPDPDFSWDSKCECVVGLRPARDKTFRLEAEFSGSKLIVHNYGHGGGGITLSWGCAVQVSKLAGQLSTPQIGKKVAVLGAGVMGLTCAQLLTHAGYLVTVYAEKLKNITSDVAGGQWAPSEVKVGSSVAEKLRFQSILKDSHDKFVTLGYTYGVSVRKNYSSKRIKNFDLVPETLVPRSQIASMPFLHMQNKKGWVYETLLVEPPIFLKRLRDELVALNVRFVKVLIKSVGEIQNENIIINCTGLGARTFFRDKSVFPIRGQLALLKSQPMLDYLYSDGSTYVFPRLDHLVVGGSWMPYDYNEVPNPVMCQQILANAKKVFEGNKILIRDRFQWMNPENWNVAKIQDKVIDVKV